MYTRKILPILFVCTLAFCSCQEKKADYFEREAKEYTEKHCPQQLDEFTRIDSIVYVKNDEAGELKLYYTLTLSDEARAEVMNKLSELGEENLRIVRNSVIYAKHKEAGVSFTYIYHDATLGDKIAEYHFTKKDYE